MSILLPSELESRAFFNTVKFTRPVNAFPTIQPRSFSALNDAKIANSDLLLGYDAPAAIGFTDNLDDDKKDAAADSIHFAERYADSETNKSLDPIGWHAFYNTALHHCGWTTTGFKYEDHVNKTVNATMENVVFDIVKLVAGRNVSAFLDVMGSTINALKSDDSLSTSFDKNSESGVGRDFRVLPCIQTPGGTAIACFIAADVSMQKQSGGFWLWKWNSSQTKMKKVASVMQLNMRIYNRNVDMIYDSLDKSSEDFFNGVKL
ncbi:hypothetical protein [Pseudomonas sp. TMB3-21]